MDSNIPASIKKFINKNIQATWEMELLGGDSGERTYFRVISSQQKYIFVEYPEDKRGFYTFIETQSLLRKNHFNVPCIYDIDEQYGYQLIEDIGSNNLNQYYLKERDLKYYEEAIECIISIQKIKTPTGHSFSKEQGFKEMDLTFQELNLNWSDKDNQCLKQEWDDLNQLLSHSTLTPAHRDFHSRNLFIYKDKLYLIDFQDMGSYPLYYDLVSLIEDSYISFSIKDRERLLNIYETVSQQNLDTSLYNLIFFQRGFKATGNFLNFYSQRNQNTHLKYVKPTLEQVQIQLERSGSYPYFLKYINQALVTL